jgi:Flp pilus assembly protein TadD
MAWWNKVFGDSGTGRIAYYDEGLALVADDKVHEALTSFRLALKASPGDVVVLQQIAMAYTRIGMTDEAEKTYRHVLQKDPQSAGAHYGVAFLLVRSGRETEAVPHLRAFLENAPAGQEASEHVSHARETLAGLTGDTGQAGEVDQARQVEGLDSEPDELR